jgi:hypothetical protein
MAKEVRIQIQDTGGFQFTFKTVLYIIMFVVMATLSAVIAFNVGRTDGLVVYRKELRAYQDSVVKPMLSLSDSLQRETQLLVLAADATKQEADVLTRQIAVIQKSNVSLRTQNKQLSDKLNSSELPPECDECKQLVTSLETEVDSLQKTIVQFEDRDTLRVDEIFLLRSGLSMQSMRGDSLEKVIINFPRPPRPKRVIGIELSNKTLFIAGTILGGVTVGIIK